MRTAVAGKVRSGVDVAHTTRSMSTGSMPARTRAWCEAAMPRVEVSSPSSAMWRCSMPVRSLIHASLVSTRRARSSLVMMRFGRWAPTPRITDRMKATSHLMVGSAQASLGPSLARLPASRGASCRLGLAQLAVQRLQVRRQPLQDIASGHVVAHFDGAGEPEGIGASVTLDGDAVEPEKRSAIASAWVHPLLQPAQARTRQECTELGRHRAGQGLAHPGRHLLGRTFSGLEGDIASKALDDHDVDGPLADLVALDEADVVDR